MKKAVISTYTHWNSFGSVLQTIGLQVLLKSFPINVSTVVFHEDEEIPAIGKQKISSLLSLFSYFYKKLNRHSLEKARTRSLEFIDERVDKTFFANSDDIEFADDSASVYIAGSDQIWHPALCRKDFFLDYAPKEKKRISYAASMGSLVVPDDKEQIFSELLQNFDSISVRESDMIPIIRKYTHKEIHQHIDPTFLVGSSEWKAYEKPYPLKKPYILVYALYWDRKINQELKELHDRTGLQIVSIQNSLRPIYAQKRVLDAGPAEFLWLIDHAEAVVTSSFHGTAFSIIFNKRFFPLVNPSAPSRIESLLTTLKVNPAPSIDELMTYSVDYSEVNRRIIEEKQRSMDYLRSEIFDEG